MIAYVDNGFDTVVKYLTKEKLDEILSSEYQRQLIQRIRKEHDHDRRSALKVKLRAMVPMGYPDHEEYLCYTEAYNATLQTVPEEQRADWIKTHRKAGYRKIEFFRPSGLFMIDVDHCQESPRKVFTDFCEAMRRHGIALKGFLAWASVTASGEGLRLILRGRKGSDIVTDQLKLAELAGLEIDAACKDITRLSFLTIAEDTLYRDDTLLFARNMEPVYQNVQLGKWQGLVPGCNKPDSVSICNNTAIPNTANQDTLNQNTEKLNTANQNSLNQSTIKLNTIKQDTQMQEGVSGASPYPTTYHGFSFDEILRTYWQLNNYGHEPMHGDRDTLTYQLACDLRHICGNDFGWLNAVIPCYDGFPQAQKEEKIRNALTSTFNAMPVRMSRVLEHLEQQAAARGERPAANATDGRAAGGCCGMPADGAGCEDEADSMPPEMPQTLPPLISLLLSRTPEVYRPAVAHAVFPSLAAHLHRVKFRYIDNVLHEATLMNVLMAGTGAGKDCISAPINYIMADIRKLDAENLQREREWKNEVNSRGANKDKRQRPEGLVIQEIDPDMTNPAFVMRMAEADGHFLYTKLNEIDQFDALKGGSGQQFRIMCLAFDPDNRYGQTRVGAQSVTEKVTIRFNWNASTTLLKGKHYFRNVLTDGPVSRINFCTIPEREIGAEMPVYGLYDATFEEQLKPYIERLCSTHGTVDCPEAFALALKLREECADVARLTQNRVYENLSFRALVIAWLKGCVLYVANGCRWDASFEDFVRWSLHYDLWCKMEFFGEAIELANQEISSPTKRFRRQNMLNLLPSVFTLEDARVLRRRRGLDEKGTRNMIWQWVSRKYIRRLDENRYEIIVDSSN